MTQMVISSIRLAEVIDPCSPPVPCVPNTNMSDPLGDCTVYYACQPSTRLWQRLQCSLLDNQTSYYDQNSGRCIVASLNPTCQERCPGTYRFHYQRISVLQGKCADTCNTAFSVVESQTWNRFPTSFWDTVCTARPTFNKHLKTNTFMDAYH